MSLGKTYQEKMTEALISACTCLFDEMRRSGKKSVYCGAPPEILLLHIGRVPPGERTPFEKLPKGSAEAFIYAGRRLAPASIKRKRSTKKQGVYFEETYAIGGYDDSGKAYITMDYGPRYASCYEYDIIDDGEDLCLANEQLLWVS